MDTVFNRNKIRDGSGADNHWVVVIYPDPKKAFSIEPIQNVFFSV